MSKHGGKRAIAILGVGILIFTLINAVLFLYYRDRTYPNSWLMYKAVGNQPISRVRQDIASAQLLPATVRLAYAGQHIEVSATELGLQPDPDAVNLHQRYWLPVANLFIRHTMGAPAKIDDAKLSQIMPKLQTAFYQAPVDAHLERDKDAFRIVAEQNGHQLDSMHVRDYILQGLARQSTAGTSLTVPVTPVVAHTQQKDLAGAQKELQTQLNTSVTYHTKTAAVKPTRSDIAAWYESSGNTFALSDTAIHAYLAKITRQQDVHAQNLSRLTNDTKTAITEHRPLDASFSLYATIKTIRYCAAGKGIDSSYLPEFKRKLDNTYHDWRGWSLDGQIEFVAADSGCDFTAWLVSPDQMASFGPICDAQWSCSPKGSNSVVINLTRWRLTTDPWQASGGSLDEYRSLAINHETGHWLGFDHLHCTGPGQPAPVMQQQSVDLEGCKFNAWPTPTEIAALKLIQHL